MARPNLVIRPEATADLAESRDWYNQRETGLGDEFLDEVDACFQRMLDHPESPIKVFLEYRRVLVRRFPYMVFYEVDGQRVEVFAVMHVARNPRTWKRRLRS